MSPSCVFVWALPALAIMSAIPHGALANEEKGDVGNRFTVSESFDGVTFDYRMTTLSEHSGYRVYRLTYPSPVVTSLARNNTIPADYYLPDGLDPNGSKRPAVVCLHILNGNFELVHMTCSALARRGIPAIMFKLPYYGERSPPDGRRALASDPVRFIEVISQGLKDVRRTVDVLASRPEVDPRRIGITGISLGGIVAATSAAQEKRLARVVLILAGGDLNQIIHHSQETADLSRMIRSLPPSRQMEIGKQIDTVDPWRNARGLRGRAENGQVMMINATDDRVIVRQCTEKLASALGISDEVVWLDGLGHYTAIAALPQALQQTTDFFAQDLPPDVKRPSVSLPANGPRDRVLLFLQQVGVLLTRKPKPGYCHFIDLSATATMAGGEKVNAELRFIRGAGERFSLQVKVPSLFEGSLGQGTYPWMVSGGKTTFQGELAEDTNPGNPLAYAERQHILKVRMLTGVFAALSIAPDTLGKFVSIADATVSDGLPAVRIVNRQGQQDRILLNLDREGKVPRGLTFEVQGVKGEVNIRAWQLNTVAHDSLFEPPGQLPVIRVDATDLYRVFSALFNFAMEHAP